MILFNFNSIEMKKKCLFFAGLIYLSLVSIELYSQDNTSDTRKPSHELNIIVDDIFAKPFIIDPSEYNDYSSEIQNIPKVGLGYKVNYNHSAFRTKVSFGSSQNSTHGPVNDAKSDYSTVSTQLTIGYGDISPISSFRAVASIHGILGFLFIAIVFARFVSMLPKMKSVQEDIETQNEETQCKTEQ